MTITTPQIPYDSFKSATEFCNWCKANDVDSNAALYDQLGEDYQKEHPHRWLIAAYDEEIAFWATPDALLKQASEIDLEEEDRDDYGVFCDAVRAWILESFAHHTGLSNAEIIDDLELDFNDDGEIETISDVTIAAPTLDDSTTWYAHLESWQEGEDGMSFELGTDIGYVTFTGANE